MRFIRQLSLVLGGVALMAACQPSPTLTENGRLVGERTLAPDEALPTLFMPATSTPLIVPTDAPTEDAPQSPATEVAGVPIATAPGEQPTSPTPTNRPSKTPTVTPTQSPVPSITPTASVTPTVTPTSLQFSFQEQQGQSSAEEATAYAVAVAAAQRRAQAAAGNDPNANNTGGNSNPPPQQRPSTNNDSNPQTVAGANCPNNPWFFSKFQPDTCPGAQTQVNNAAYVNFERGYMIWLEATGQIYTIYTTSGQPEWEQFEDTWTPGYPGCSEEDRRYDPQRQAWTPKSGFCKVWTENGDVADRIGWALYNYEVAYQPSYQPGQDGSVAIEDPDGSVFYLNADGTWELWR